MTKELNLSRQSKLVPAEKISQYKIEVFGVGSIGSHVVKTLAKTGFKRIKVYDMDIVEEENIAAQAYDFKHVKMNKVDAIKEIVKESTGIEIETAHGQLDDKTEITPEPNTIYCCFFDSFEGRKLVFNKLKDYPIIFVDGRIGRYDMRYYLVDCSDQEARDNYAKTLEVKATSELICGEKASAPINLMIAGKIVMDIVAYISGQDYVKVYLGNAMTPSTQIVVYQQRKKPKEEAQIDASSVEELALAVADEEEEEDQDLFDWNPDPDEELD